jgi:hypothetical protein
VDEHRLRVFENRVLRRILGPKRDDVTGEWRKLHNKELHDLYSSPSIIRMIKSKRMRWAGNLASMVTKRKHIGIWWRSEIEKIQQEDLDVGEKIILKWILERWCVMVSTGLMWYRVGTSGGSSEYGDQVSRSITLYTPHLKLTSPTRGDRSVGIVRSRTKATECV